MSTPRRLFSKKSSSKSYDPTLSCVITVTLLLRFFLLSFHLNRHCQSFLFFQTFWRLEFLLSPLLLTPWYWHSVLLNFISFWLFYNVSDFNFHRRAPSVTQYFLAHSYSSPVSFLNKKFFSLLGNSIFIPRLNRFSTPPQKIFSLLDNNIVLEIFHLH